MAILDRSQVINNGRITPFSAWSNRSYLAGKNHRLDAVLAAAPRTGYLGSTLPMDIPGASLDPQTVTAMNAEAGYLVNLYRQATGQPPIDPRTNAPTVHVGIDPATQKLLIAGGLVAVLLWARSRRR